MTVQFEDTFNRADGDIDNGWTTVGGDPNVHNNELHMDGFGNAIARAVPVACQSEAIATLVFAADSKVGTGETLDIRLRATSNYLTAYQFRLTWAPYGQSHAEIYKIVGGSYTKLAEGLELEYVTGPNTIVARAVDNELTLSCNNVVFVTTTDNDIASGDYVYMSFGYLQEFALDNFTLEDATPLYELFLNYPNLVASAYTYILTFTGENTGWVAGVNAPGTTITVDQGQILGEIVLATDTCVILYFTPTAQTVTFTAVVEECEVQAIVEAPDMFSDADAAFFAHQSAESEAVFRMLADQWGTGGGGDPDVDTLLAIIGQDDPQTQTVSEKLNILLGDTTAIRNDLEMDTTGPDSILHVVKHAASDAADASSLIGGWRTVSNYTAQDILDAISSNPGSGPTLAEILAGVLGGTEEDPNPDVAAQLAPIAAALDPTNDALSDQIALAQATSTLTLAAAVANLFLSSGADAAVIAGKVADWVAMGTNVGAFLLDLLAFLTARGQQPIDSADGSLRRIFTAVQQVQDMVGYPATEVPTPATGLYLALDDAEAAIRGEDSRNLTTLYDLLEGHDGATFQRDGVMDGKLDQIIALLQGASNSERGWPGEDNVTIVSTVPISGNVKVDMACDGIVWEVTSRDIPHAGVTIWGETSWRTLGWASFYSDRGDYDRFQTISWQHGCLVPQHLLTAAGCVLHFDSDVHGTVSLWVRNPSA